MSNSLENCPHCGKSLSTDPKFTYAFKKWATPIYVVLISIMLILIDIFNDNNINWAQWAILGVWTVYIPVQILRTSPYYGWIIIPIGGFFLSVFLFALDRSTGDDNNKLFDLSWAGYAIAPIFTFIVAFPIVAHYARDQPTQIERLELFIEKLENEE